MKLNDKIRKFKGHAKFEIRDAYSGEVLDKWECYNTMATSGFVQVAKLINGESTDVFTDIAIGEGTTPAAVGDTELESLVAQETATTDYEATAKATFEYLFTFTSGEEYSITEAGVFVPGSGGIMLDRFVFSAKEVDVDKTLYCFITVTVA